MDGVVVVFCPEGVVEVSTGRGRRAARARRRDGQWWLVLSGVEHSLESCPLVSDPVGFVAAMEAAVVRAGGVAMRDVVPASNVSPVGEGGARAVSHAAVATSPTIPLRVVGGGL